LTSAFSTLLQLYLYKVGTCTLKPAPWYIGNGPLVGELGCVVEVVGCVIHFETRYPSLVVIQHNFVAWCSERVALQTGPTSAVGKRSARQQQPSSAAHVVPGYQLYRVTYPARLSSTRMSFFKKSKKPPRPSQHLAIGIPTHIALGPLGLTAHLSPDIVPKGASRRPANYRRRCGRSEYRPRFKVRKETRDYNSRQRCESAAPLTAGFDYDSRTWGECHA
jgi:hypothetical protein